MRHGRGDHAKLSLGSLAFQGGPEHVSSTYNKRATDIYVRSKKAEQEKEKEEKKEKKKENFLLFLLWISIISITYVFGNSDDFKWLYLRNRWTDLAEILAPSSCY